MKTYQVEIQGKQPLLMHSDDIEWSDTMDKWRLDKDNKKVSRAGDDRTPAWRWLGCLYHNHEHVVIPIANIMRNLMEAGAMVLVPGGRAGKTFKAQTQSGIMPGVKTASGWPLVVNGKPLPYAPFEELVGQKDFDKHKEAAIAHGFELFIKRAKIGASKHVRVRPKFDQWSTKGELVVTDEQITTSILEDILDCGGTYKGLGDWRPSSKTPGFYGMFEATVKELS